MHTVKTSLGTSCVEGTLFAEGITSTTDLLTVG